MPLYGLATLVRRSLYDRGWLPHSHAGIPTVSVGGLEAGGTGKTPVARWILAHLLASGRRPGLLTRGYGRPGSALGLRTTGEPLDPVIIGDEPAMLLEELDVPAAAFGDRIAGARELRRRAPEVDCLVLDDGFAHRRLDRDLDIVVLRGEAPYGTGHLLPWGPLREPPSSLKRADVHWFHFRTAAPSAFEPPQTTPTSVVSVAEPRLVAGEFGAGTVLVATGVAHPEGVVESATRLGAEVVGHLAFPDHHRFSDADIARIEAERIRLRASQIAVTRKDAVKLRRLSSGLGWAEIDVFPRIVEGREALDEALGDRLFEATATHRTR